MRWLLIVLAAVPALAEAPVALERQVIQLDLQGWSGFEHPVPGSGELRLWGQRVRVRERRGLIEVRCGSARTLLIELPALVSLATPSGPRAIAIARRGDRLVWSSRWGARAVVGGERFVLIDLDADGRLASPEADGLVVPGTRTVAPWTGQAWGRRAGWGLRPVGQGLRASRVEGPPTASLRAAFAELNHARQAAGLGALAWDAEMARGCAEHASYINRTGQRRHDQDPASPHYSKAGDAMGRSGVLGFIQPSPLAGINEQLTTAYHLSSLLSSRSRKVGIGFRLGTFVANAKADRSGPHPGDGVRWVWPPHGAADVPRAFCPRGEYPMPLPGRETRYRIKIGQVVMAEVKGKGPYALELTDPRGRRVPGTLTSPDEPLPGHGATREDNADLVILAPDTPLAADTRYTATLRYTRRGQPRVERWRFTTGPNADRTPLTGR